MEEKDKIAFVGISNWILDASKMNRGIFLSVPIPNKEDLEKTSQAIAESYDKNLSTKNKDLFQALADTYFEYKKEMEEKYTKKDYHGLRDFYYLIKTVIQELIKIKNKNILIDDNIKGEIALRSLERNFSGLEFDISKTNSLEIIKTIFKKKFINCDINKGYNLLKNIYDNINYKDSRYLLLISKISISKYLINYILNSPECKKNINKISSFYEGSGFKNDLHSEGYELKILNKIQFQMEQNKILILSNLEGIYTPLYDLFNKNFTVISKKNYTKISLINNVNYTFVNDGFKCIILMDEDSIEKEKDIIPFLNRFEKHIISFEYLLDKEYIKEAEKIYHKIQNFAQPNLKLNNINIKFNLENLLINCEKNEIFGIIFKKYSEMKFLGKKINMKDLIDVVLEKISLTLPQDIIFLQKNSEKDNFYLNKIINFYKRGDHNNLINFFRTMKNSKNVIYIMNHLEI